MTRHSSDFTVSADLIRDVPDFPRPGILFKDITPLLADPEGFSAAIDLLVASAPANIDVVMGMEARGFLFAAPVALATAGGSGIGAAAVRKPAIGIDGGISRPV